MSWQPGPQPALQRRRSPAGVALRVILLFIAALYVVEVLDVVTGDRLQRNHGVEPREAHGLDGVLLAPLLHGSWGHLMANTVPLLVLGFFLLLGGVARWGIVTALVWLVGGVGTWFTGGEGTVHVGASVLAFGWLTYLLLTGLFSRKPEQLVVGFVLLFLYGGLLWGVLPGQPGISWQGHLFGAVGGAVAAWQLGRRDRQSGRVHR